MSTAIKQQQQDWVSVLSQACISTSQKRVSDRLRQPDNFPSPTVINQVLKHKYPGRTERLQALVEGVYMNRTVNCQVLGEIPADICEEHQIREFANTNNVRVRLYQACHNTCPHSRVRED